jgi:hypothetical protein
MSEKKSVSEKDPLVLQEVYPEASSVFEFQPASLGSALSSCVVVLDTNVLLVPYGTGKESLNQVRQIYADLVKKHRLVIPAQVAREFAQNRAEKLKTVFQQVSRKRDVAVKSSSYPLLESLAEYKAVVDLEDKIGTLLDDYRKQVGKLADVIRSWYWNDPVSAVYKELFDGAVVVDASDLNYLRILSVGAFTRSPRDIRTQLRMTVASATCSSGIRFWRLGEVGS